MKIKKILGAIVLAALVVLPIKASAATYGTTYEFIGENAKNAKVGDILTVQVTGINEGGASTNTVSFKMSMTGLEYVEGSAQGQGSWIVASQDSTGIVFSNENSVSDAKYVVGTFQVRKTVDEGCELSIICNGVQKKLTPPTPTTPNVKTGNFVPYIVIGSGIAIAGAVYYVTRRNNKFYRI